MMGSAPIIVNGYDIKPFANLHGANLCGANLHGANLHGCIFGRSTSAIFLGTDTRGYDFIAIRHDDGWRIKAGCHWLTLPAAIAHWTTADNRDALARLAILDAHPLPEGER